MSIELLDEAEDRRLVADWLRWRWNTGRSATEGSIVDFEGVVKEAQKYGVSHVIFLSNLK